MQLDCKDWQTPNQDLYGGIEISLKKAQGMEIYYAKGSRLFLQKDFKTGLPMQKGKTMVESHFCDKGIELGYAGVVQPLAL